MYPHWHCIQGRSEASEVGGGGGDVGGFYLKFGEPCNKFHKNIICIGAKNCP